MHQRAHRNFSLLSKSQQCLCAFYIGRLSFLDQIEQFLSLFLCNGLLFEPLAQLDQSGMLRSGKLAIDDI